MPINGGKIRSERGNPADHQLVKNDEMPFHTASAALCTRFQAPSHTLTKELTPAWINDQAAEAAVLIASQVRVQCVATYTIAATSAAIAVIMPRVAMFSAINAAVAAAACATKDATIAAPADTHPAAKAMADATPHP